MVHSAHVTCLVLLPYQQSHTGTVPTNVWDFCQSVMLCVLEESITEMQPNLTAAVLDDFPPDITKKQLAWVNVQMQKYNVIAGVLCRAWLLLEDIGFTLIRQMLNILLCISWHYSASDFYFLIPFSQKLNLRQQSWKNYFIFLYKLSDCWLVLVPESSPYVFVFWQ